MAFSFYNSVCLAQTPVLWGWHADTNDPLPKQIHDNMIAQVQFENQQHAMQNAEELRKGIGDANTEIADARRRFWELYPDKPGFAEAKKQFSDVLFSKDMIYMLYNKRDLALAGVGDKTIDGGIPSTALAEFTAWKNFIRDQVYGKGQYDYDNLSLEAYAEAPFKMPGALIASAKVYQAYTVARDWAEFDMAGREPAGFDSPQMYGALLYIRGDQMPVEQAEKTFAGMEKAVGPAKLDAIVQKVHAAKKDKFWDVIDVEQFGVTPSKTVGTTGPYGEFMQDTEATAPAGINPLLGSNPLDLVIHLATRDDARLYIESYSSTRPPGPVIRLHRTHDWDYAVMDYDLLAKAFGIGATNKAAAAVLGATKIFENGLIADPKAIGARDEDPYGGFRTILYAQNPKETVRLFLMEENPSASDSEIDSAYQQLVSKYGEPAIFNSEQGLVSQSPHGYDFGLKDLRGVLDGTTVLKQPQAPAPVATAQIDNPDYEAWTGCPPGAMAEYIETQWKGTGAYAKIDYPYFKRRHTFQSLSAEKVTLVKSELSYFERDIFTTGMSAPTDQPEYIFAKADAVVPPALNGSGVETLVIHGKEVPCHWESLGPVTTWTSSMVPGHLVRQIEIDTDPTTNQTSYDETCLLDFTPLPAGAQPPVPAPGEKQVATGLLNYRSPVLANLPLGPQGGESAAAPPPPSAPATGAGGHPMGIVIADRPGFVKSPFAMNQPPIDVRGYPPNTPMRCPYTNKIFLIPQTP